MKTFHLLSRRKQEGEWIVARGSGARYKVVLWWLVDIRWIYDNDTKHNDGKQQYA